MEFFKNPMLRLRWVARIEGISFLMILFITMPLKYVWNMPGPNKFWGMTHGLLFILYCLMVVQIWIANNWSTKKGFLALIASIIPFGTFWAEKKLFKD
jgi:integral membrane protein